MINVSIVKCHNYDPQLVLKSLRTAIESSGDFPEVKNKKVLVKPNLLYPVPPEKAVTTHPVIVDSLLVILKEKGAKEIYVGDSPGIATTDAAGKKTGVMDVVLKQEAKWADFSKPVQLEYKEGKKQKLFYPAQIVTECDIIISVPKLKTHEMMYFTGAMKNLFGIIPGLNKSRFHFNYPEKDDFASMIVDLNGALKADYSVMDAIVGMEGPGPGSGYPKELGFIAVSSNILALDITAASIIGYDPMSIPILSEAFQRKIWLNKMNEIQYPQEKPENVKPDQFKRVKVLKDTGFIKNVLPEKLYKLVKDLYVPRPFMSKKRCIACGKCIEICPPDAIRLADFRNKKIASVDYGKCIRCFCCHEVCPVDAIRVGRI